MQLARVSLCCSDPASVASSSDYHLLVKEFPSVSASLVDSRSGEWPAPSGDEHLRVHCDDWLRGNVDFYDFDARISALEDADPTIDSSAGLVVAGPCEQLAAAAFEILTRAQRLVARTNVHSRSALFAEIREIHRAMHDLALPLVRADYAHAVDTWQWVLRLSPSASLAVQAAALFHDVERLASEPLRRIEQHAADYRAFKDAHARAGSAVTERAISDLPIDSATRERIGYLVARHERPEGEPELALLNDADALSFFSLNSAGYLDYYGEEQTRRKIEYTLGRMRPEARRRLDRIRYRDDFRDLLDGPPS